MTGSETVALAKALRTGTDPTIIAIAGVASAANTAPYFTGVDTADVYSLTAAARTVLDDATVAAMVDTLGGAASTGTGGIARKTGSAFTTPDIGVATGTSLNLGATDAMVLHGVSITSQVQVNSDVLAVEEIHTHGATATIGALIYGARSRGTTASPTIVQSGDTLRADSAMGYDGVDYEEAGRLLWTVGGTPGSNDMPGKLEIQVTPDGGFTPATAVTVNPDKTVTFAGVVTLADGAVLGTPASGVATNLTGTAAGLTAGAVTTNANLTGPVTSVGNATTIADAELAAIAGLTSLADKGIQFTGSGTAATYDLTTAGKALLDDADAAAQRTTLGLGTLATQSGTFSGTSSGTNTGDQTAIANATLATMADQTIKGNVSGGSATPSDLTATQVRTMLALVIGTNAQAWDADLDAIAALSSAANKIPYSTGAQAWSLADFPAAMRTFLTTPSSANLAGLLSDDGGSGILTFGLAKYQDSGVSNSGTVLAATPVALVGSTTTASVGVFPEANIHLVKFDISFQCAVATASPTATIDVFKNASTGASARIFEVSQALTAGVGYRLSTTTVINSGTDAITTTDYYTIVISTTGTNCSLTQCKWRLSGTFD